MFRVTADTLQAYLDVDPKRKQDLIKLHQLICEAAPDLKRYFHKGTPAPFGICRVPSKVYPMTGRSERLAKSHLG